MRVVEGYCMDRAGMSSWGGTSKNPTILRGERLHRAKEEMLVIGLRVASLSWMSRISSRRDSPVLFGIIVYRRRCPFSH